MMRIKILYSEDKKKSKSYIQKIISDQHNKNFEKICLNYWYSAIFVLLGTCTEYLIEIFCPYVNTDICTFLFCLSYYT